jgi:hypothetical protein
MRVGGSTNFGLRVGGVVVEEASKQSSTLRLRVDQLPDLQRCLCVG